MRIFLELHFCQTGMTIISKSNDWLLLLLHQKKLQRYQVLHLQVLSQSWPQTSQQKVLVKFTPKLLHRFIIVLADAQMAEECNQPKTLLKELLRNNRNGQRQTGSLLHEATLYVARKVKLNILYYIILYYIILYYIILYYIILYYIILYYIILYYIILYYIILYYTILYYINPTYRIFSKLFSRKTFHDRIYHLREKPLADFSTLGSHFEEE